MMRKFGGRMADMAGRAMKNPSKDMMGRAMARAGQSPVGVAPPVRANRPVEPEMSYKKGGNVKDSKAMAKKEIAFMKKKGVKKMAMGGLGGLREGDTSYQLTGGRRGTDSQLSGANRMARPREATGVAMSGGRSFGPGGMKKGGMAKSGGSYRKAADGVAHKGKTKGKMVKMNKGGYC